MRDLIPAHTMGSCHLLSYIAPNFACLSGQTSHSTMGSPTSLSAALPDNMVHLRPKKTRLTHKILSFNTN